MEQLEVDDGARCSSSIDQDLYHRVQELLGSLQVLEAANNVVNQQRYDSSLVYYCQVSLWPATANADAMLISYDDRLL
jgi:hypothetical protein